MTTLVLIRHGRSVANSEGVLAGRAPGVGLDDVGRAQARRLRELLARVEFAAVHRSPILRCEQTARLAGWPDALVEDRLTECDYGTWTNRPLAELSEDPLWRRVLTEPSRVSFPGGESLLAMRDRVVAAAADVAARHQDGEAVALISHGDPIKAILSHALRQRFDDFQRLMVAPASVSVVDFPRGRTPLVWCINANSDVAGQLLTRSLPLPGGGDVPAPGIGGVRRD